MIGKRTRSVLMRPDFTNYDVSYKIFNRAAPSKTSLQEIPEEWSRPTAQELSNSIGDTTSTIKRQKETGSIAGGRVSGAFCEFSEINDLVILGDIHGDYDCLAQILDEVSCSEFLSDPKNKIVFLGDYVDRGDNSAGVLNVVCKLKTTYADSVVLMRGNHEAPAEFPFSSHDFPFQLADLYGESQGRDVYRKALTLFRELTVAALVVGRILLVHGGLPTQDNVVSDYAKRISLAPDSHLRDSALEEVLWNDPRDIKNPWENSDRGIGKHFGPAITRKWLQATAARCVVRGHEPCQGFRLDHEDKILTLFSSRAPYPSAMAAYIFASDSQLRQIRDARDLAQYVKYPS